MATKLPVEKTLAEIREELFARIEEVQDEYAAAGWLPSRLNVNKGVIRGVIEIFAWGLYQLYQAMYAVLLQAFPSDSSSTWLDLHGEQVELTRKAATKASGVVIFEGEAAGNTRIPAGTIIRTPTDGAGLRYRYATTADVVMTDGSSTVVAEVEAEEYGAAANAVAGQISEMVTAVSGVTGVTNASDWLTSEGADEETDEDLAARYVLRWMETNGATKYAYESWALGVSGVIAVKILDRHPRGQGTVDVIVKGAAGIPTQALLDQVAAVVEEQRPINDDVDVRGPDPVAVAIAAELEIVSGDPDAIRAEAEARIQALFTDPNTVSGVEPLQIGEDLPLDRLAYTLMAIKGVKRINWTSPAADVAVSDDGLAVLASLSITTAWAAEA